MKARFVLAALLLAAHAPVHAGSAAATIECMRTNIPPTLSIQELEFRSADPYGGTRTMKGRLYVTRENTAQSRELVRAMFKVSSPASYAGAAYLVRETSGGDDHEIYAYLPAVRRVRRISGAFADGPLFGTDFSYDDFRQLQTLFTPSGATFEGADLLEGRPVSVISFNPQSRRYDRVRTWIDASSCVPLKTEFLQGRSARKRFSATPGALQRATGGFWYLSEVMMDDLAERSATVLRILGFTPATQLPARYFDPQAFYLAQ